MSGCAGFCCRRVCLLIFMSALEEHGSAVWRLIDGRRTVQEIVSLLADHFHPDENYASRVTTYVMQLRKDGFIKLLSSVYFNQTSRIGIE